MAYSEELLASYGFYAAVVVLKVLLMAPLTGFFRLSNKTFANEEDAKAQGGKVGVDEQVERVRRAHLNDLENAVPFVLIGLVYVLVAEPSSFLALLHFRAFTVARIAHTVIYVAQGPPKARGAAFFVGLVACVSMCLQIIF